MWQSRSTDLCRQTPLLLLLALGIGACDAPARESGTAGVAAAGTDTIMVEGMPEPIRYAPLRSPDGFPLAFTTRLPERLRAVRESEEQIRFDFDGPAGDSAYLRVVVLPAGTSERRARDVVLALATEIRALGSGGQEVREGRVPQEHPGAILAYPLSGQIGGRTIHGLIALGTHADRFFYIMEVYPPESGDGVAPRFHYLLSHWRWRDSGTSPSDGGT